MGASGRSVRSLALLAVVGVAAVHGGSGGLTAHAAAPLDARAAMCTPGKTCYRDAADALQLSLPDGRKPCPDSGAGASCSGPATATSTSVKPAVAPSVPVSTIRQLGTPTLTLESSVPAALSGGIVVLTASASLRLLQSGKPLEIFDLTTQTLVGSCSQGTDCAVSYSAADGVHTFQAVEGDAISQTVAVGWVRVSIATNLTAVGPGSSVTLTATTTIPVEQLGYSIQLFDMNNPAPISFCSRGTSCSVAVVDPSSGSRSFGASVGPATSDQVAVTWLSSGLTGTAAYRPGDIIHLEASANTDLTNTPWSLGILDDQGRLVAPACKTGASCSADIAVTSAASPRFTAVVGAVPPPIGDGTAAQLLQKATQPSGLIDIQAQSAAFAPARLLWGVDSCKAFTGDPTGEIYASVAGGLGRPDFWGRYLTRTACPAISAAEVATAHDRNMGILPIYNDFDCSNVAGYDTAIGYANAAVSAAQDLQIPQGRALAIDVEPPGPYCSGGVDDAFVRGWFDGVTAAGYVPVYYGNGTSGSEFAGAYCTAQTVENEISTGSFIWSFEPSLEGGSWSKSNRPAWGPNTTGCPDTVAAWQYQIDVNSPNPNVDSDEVLSTLPLWYP